MAKKMYAVYGALKEDDGVILTGCGIHPTMEEAEGEIRTIFADIIRNSSDLEGTDEKILKAAKEDGSYREDLNNQVFEYDLYTYCIEPVPVSEKDFMNSKEIGA